MASPALGELYVMRRWRPWGPLIMDTLFIRLINRCRLAIAGNRALCWGRIELDLKSERAGGMVEPINEILPGGLPSGWLFPSACRPSVARSFSLIRVFPKFGRRGFLRSHYQKIRETRRGCARGKYGFRQHAGFTGGRAR